MSDQISALLGSGPVECKDYHIERINGVECVVYAASAEGPKAGTVVCPSPTQEG